MEIEELNELIALSALNQDYFNRAVSELNQRRVAVTPEKVVELFDKYDGKPKMGGHGKKSMTELCYDDEYQPSNR